jgi:hypothetical protein
MASKNLAWALLFLLGILFLSQLSVVRADDVDDEEEAGDIEIADDDAGDDDDYEDYEDDVEEEFDGTVVAHPDVETRVIFPDYPTKQFVVGKPVVALVAFANHARNKAFNITAVGAHLHSPFDLSYYIQNFTVREQDALVGPGYQVSVEYVFMTDPSLEPLEFWFSAWVQYNSTDGRTFRTTFTNGTIELIEKPSEFNAKTFFGYVVAVAVVAVGGFAFWNSQQSGSSRSRATKSAVERGTSGAAASTDGGWGAAYVPKAQADRVSRGKSNKGKKSDTSS